MVEATGRLVGDATALESARTFVAWAHGFTSLELVGGFRLGGDVDAAYPRGIELILGRDQRAANPPSGSPRRG